MSGQSISDYILQDEERLRVAAAIYDAWSAVRDQITKGFLTKLSSRLLTRLPDWKSDTWGIFYEDTYANYYLYKPGWNLEYYISLQFRDGGMNMRFGVVRDENKISDRPLSAEILAAVRKSQPSAKQSAWWEAYILMRSPAKDWRGAEIMWKMHRDDSFLEAVAEQLQAVARATEPILDGLAESNKRGAK